MRLVPRRGEEALDDDEAAALRRKVRADLDAVKRDACTVKREPGSSPLQALVLLNGPQFVEASRVLAEGLMKDFPGDPDRGIREAFRRLTSLEPTDVQRKILRDMLDDQRKHFQGNPDAAKQFTRVGLRKPGEDLDPAELATRTVRQTVEVLVSDFLDHVKASSLCGDGTCANPS